MKRGVVLQFFANVYRTRQTVVPRGGPSTLGGAMARFHQRPFFAAEAGSVFGTKVGIGPGRVVGVEVPREPFSSNQIFVKSIILREHSTLGNY